MPHDADTENNRARNTIIYFLSSASIALVGTILILFGNHVGPDGSIRSATVVSIGASLLAGGIASTGFVLLRYIDDKDDSSHLMEFERIRDDLESRIARFDDDAREYAATVGQSVRYLSSADVRCVSDLEIRESFRQEFIRAEGMSNTNCLDVDVVGVKLYRFVSDQMDWIEARSRPTQVRLLIQHPDTEAFRAICKFEARSIQATIRDIASTIRWFDGAVVKGDSLVWNRGHVSVQIRLFRDYQPITLFRVSDVAYTRPRIRTPRGAASRFYEIYAYRDSRLQFEGHQLHFDDCWKQSIFENSNSLTRLLARGMDPTVDADG